MGSPCRANTQSTFTKITVHRCFEPKNPLFEVTLPVHFYYKFYTTFMNTRFDIIGATMGSSWLRTLDPKIVSLGAGGCTLSRSPTVLTPPLCPIHIDPCHYTSVSAILMHTPVVPHGQHTSVGAILELSGSAYTQDTCTKITVHRCFEH